MFILSLDKIGQIGVGAVDGTEAGQEGHHGDADDTHTTNALLDWDDAMFGTENGKRVARFPKERDYDHPQDACGQKYETHRLNLI